MNYRLLILSFFIFSCAGKEKFSEANRVPQSQSIDDVFNNFTFAQLKLIPVDQTYRGNSTPDNVLRTALSSRRSVSQYESCLSPQKAPINFYESIAAGVVAALKPQASGGPKHLKNILSLKTEVPVSLISHPLCESTMLHNSGEISDFLNFTSSSNKDRDLINAGDEVALHRFVNRWTAFLGCLVADISLNIYSEDKPRNSNRDFESLRRLSPIFLEDTKAISSLASGVELVSNNMLLSVLEEKKGYKEDRKVKNHYYGFGLFSFNNNRIFKDRVNLVNSWNAATSNASPACKIDNKDNALLAITSSGQGVNAFMGVQSILDSFYVQVNTTLERRTHKSNVISNDKLHNPMERCVSISGKDFYHYLAPLHRGSQSRNYKQISNCITIVNRNLDQAQF